MREIKLFRAWDRLCKRYWYSGFSISWDGRVQNLCSGIQNDRIKAGWTLEKSYTDVCKFDLEQFTGLKDKNGKEIYEGDIVMIGCYALRAVITYEHCSFRMFHVSGSKRRKYCGNGRSELIFHNCDISTEIIGDIHTTPELMKGK